ncbi:hypothetical protein AB0O01_33285 [Streptomyces sp. NPDC093252]|uniref:hypothetical protein n=1 Tax=Streptomyces sp. NPDC093252 TaxID=3154980 RepID=UPI003426A025
MLPTALSGAAPAGPAAPVAGVQHTGSPAQHADEPCVTGCAAHARGTRYEHPGERPSPLDQHATHTRFPAPAPADAARAAARVPAPSLSPAPADRHRGRAPPAHPGI